MVQIPKLLMWMISMPYSYFKGAENLYFLKLWSLVFAFSHICPLRTQFSHRIKIVKKAVHQISQIFILYQSYVNCIVN